MHSISTDRDAGRNTLAAIAALKAQAPDTYPGGEDQRDLDDAEIDADDCAGRHVDGYDADDLGESPDY